MSSRSNGMIAHVAKPGNLDDALDKVMLPSRKIRQPKPPPK
jgi:hypothetical protein